MHQQSTFQNYANECIKFRSMIKRIGFFFFFLIQHFPGNKLFLPFSSLCGWAVVRAAASTPSCRQSWCRCQVSGSHCSSVSTHPQSSGTETFSRLPSPALGKPCRPCRPCWRSERGRGRAEVETEVQRPQSPFSPLRSSLLAKPSHPRASSLAAKQLSYACSEWGGGSCGLGKSGYSHSGSAWLKTWRRCGGKVRRGAKLWRTESSSCVSWSTNRIPWKQRP